MKLLLLFFVISTADCDRFEIIISSILVDWELMWTHRSLNLPPLTTHFLSAPILYLYFRTWKIGFTWVQIHLSKDKIKKKGREFIMKEKIRLWQHDNNHRWRNLREEWAAIMLTVLVWAEKGYVAPSCIVQIC